MVQKVVVGVVGVVRASLSAQFTRDFTIATPWVDGSCV